jgi:hypothetical protein
VNYSSVFECREPGVLPEDLDDEELEQHLAEREAEWERQQRAADAWREAALDDGDPPWTWGPADEARIERAVAEVRRDLGLRDETEPF